MEREKAIKFNKPLLFLIIMFSVGVIGHLIPNVRPLMISLTPFTLLFTGIITFYSSFRKGNSKFILWGVTVYIVTFSLEVISVKTGYVFGNYIYGDVLGLKVFGVPLIIGFNWVVIILGAIGISSRIHKSSFQIALLTGTLAVLFDLMLEPVAINLGYWEWQKGVIPLQNYYAWFGIAFFASLFCSKLKLDLEDSLFIYYFLIQFVFFILLSIFMS